MFKRFISYYKPYKKVFFFDMFSSLMVSLIGLMYPIVTRLITKDYVPEKNIEAIIISGIILLVLYILRALFKFFVQYQGHVMGVHMQADMRRELFDKMEELPYTFFDNNETGRIMSRMTNDLQQISELAHHGPENIFICGLTVVLAFIYLCAIQWKLALLIFAVVPVLAIVSLIMRKRMNKAFMESRIAVAEINANVESSITGIRVTKAFNNKELEKKKFEVGNQAYVKARRHSYKAMAQFQSSTAFVTDIFNVVLILCGGIFLFNELIDLSDYATFVVSVSLFITPLTTLINFVEQFEEGVTGFTRFTELMDQKPEQEKEDAKAFDIEGNISFKNVSFEYNEKEPVLNNINLEIKKGDNIALVGPSGGGKTTICHLIPRFYELSKGDILIDGHSIKDFTFKSLRSQIGIVQQDVFLFNGTIRDNIIYGKLDATEEEVIEAAKNANIYDHIMAMPDGFDTIVGERGVRLSGGQKQRLSIARVFLKNPKILILDEATSALDNTTETLIQKALKKLCEGRTTLVVAHRLSTIKNSNHICVVSHGNIIEDGTHEELISKNGVYKTLYDAQFKEPEDVEYFKIDEIE